MSSNTGFINHTETLEDYKVKIVGGRIIRYKVENTGNKEFYVDNNKSSQDLKAKKEKSADEKNAGKNSHHKNEIKHSKNGTLQENNHSLDLHLKFCPTTLPSQPITLTLEEEKELERRLRRELAESSVQSLKNCYLSLHRSDLPTKGFRVKENSKDTICSFEQLAYSLYRYKMNISLWNLRLVASVFTTGGSDVDYEEVLKYISKHINNPIKSEKKIKKKTRRKSSGAHDDNEKVLLSEDNTKSRSISYDNDTRKRSLTETNRSNPYNIISNIEYTNVSNNNTFNTSIQPNKNTPESGNKDYKKQFHDDDDEEDDEEEEEEDEENDDQTDGNDSDDDEDNLRSEKIDLLLKVMSKEKFASKESMLDFIEDYSTLLKLSINHQHLANVMSSGNNTRGKIDGKIEAERLRAFFEEN